VSFAQLAGGRIEGEIVIWKRAGVIGVFLSAAGAACAAEGPAQIPVAFHGAGCNLKYTYARAPKGNASDCIAARANRNEGEGIIEDNFIRIDKGGITGFEWSCQVKTVKAASETEFTFAGTCGDEGAEYTGTATLLLRPGRLVIIHKVIEGRHAVDIYRLRDDLE
jgi:hypothetical protein